MWRTIRELLAQGCSIVLTTHYLEEAEALADRVAVVASGRLIASGSVAQIRSLVSRKQISCSSALTADEVRSWPDVVAVTRETRRLHITVVDAEAVVRRLLAADDHVRDLEIRQAGLAEAFTGAHEGGSLMNATHSLVYLRPAAPMPIRRILCAYAKEVQY